MAEANVRVPRWTPGQRELDDLDLLLQGSFGPLLPGFVDPTTAGNAAPVTLVVSKDVADVAAGVGDLDLVDPEGAPVARMRVTGTWPAGHDAGDQVGLVGPVQMLSPNEFGPFRRLHLAPALVHATTPAAAILAVAVRRPLTAIDLDQIRTQAASHGLRPLLLACVGVGMPSGVSAPALVRATLAAAELIGPDSQVVAVSLADHGDDHADDDGADHADDVNDWLMQSVASAYGTRTLRLGPSPGGAVPAAVARIVTKDRPPRDRRGVVVFLTGLSGSGKSTLARALADHLLEQGDRTVTSLDGDVVRHHLSKGLGFSREDRETNILRIGFVAAEIARHGGLALCSPIAPFEATRAAVEQMVEHAGAGFVLIHVATPLAECERRDRKGLYAKARAGEIADFTGISSPYETPMNAIKIDTTNRDIVDCLDEILAALVAEGWLLP